MQRRDHAGKKWLDFFTTDSSVAFYLFETADSDLRLLYCCFVIETSASAVVI